MVFRNATQVVDFHFNHTCAWDNNPFETILLKHPSPCPDPQWKLTKYQFHQPGGVATPLLQFEDGGGDLIYNLPLQDIGFF